MASIAKRATTRGDRYDVRYRDPHGKPRKRTFRRLADARAYSRVAEADVLRGEWIDPAAGRLTFAEWWEKWWPSTVHLRPTTRARDESYYRTHLGPRFGAMRLGGIDHAEVAAWVAELDASGRAPATVVKALQILHKTLDAAVDSGLIKSNPSDRVKPPKVERREMLFLTPAQVADLADAIGPRYRALVLTGAYCGLRFGELAGLTRQRVDVLHRRIEVAEIVTEVRGHHYTGPPKTRAGHRSVPMPRIVADALDTHLATVTGDIVFPSPEGAYLRGSLFRVRIWHPACVRAGVGTMVKDEATGKTHYEGLRLHDLRHTAVALWIAAGASPKEVANRAGHASVVTVLDRYGHLLPGLEDRVTDALDAMAEAVPVPAATTVRAMDAPWTEAG